MLGLVFGFAFVLCLRAFSKVNREVPRAGIALSNSFPWVEDPASTPSMR